jgi:FkbM family methyltransferase
MPWNGLKKRLFRAVGPGGYRALHAAWFRLRLMRALRSRRYAESFFGNDLLAFAAKLHKGGTVLDIGAFLGGSTALFARAVGPSGRVAAFEPVHHRRLSQVTRMLRLRQVTVEASALTDRNGDSELMVPIRDGVPLYSQAAFAESHAAAAAQSGYAFERSPTRLERLDDYLARAGIEPESVAAVKIDVEGSEMKLFAGGEDFFRRFRGPILCEFWFDVMPPPGWSWLRERGYRCRYLDRKGLWSNADDAGSLGELCRGETYGNFFLEKTGTP